MSDVMASRLSGWCGLEVPDSFAISASAVKAIEPTDADGRRAAQRFVNASDVRNDIYVDVGMLAPGASSSLQETDVREHRCIVLDGQGNYLEYK